MAESTGLVLFSGFNVRAVVALCRFLSGRGGRAYLVARSSKDPTFLTECASWVVAVRVQTVEEYCGKVRQRANLGDITILPSTEYLNRVLLSGKPVLEKSGIDIPLVGEATYRQLSDKGPFADICREDSPS